MTGTFFEVSGGTVTTPTVKNKRLPRTESAVHLSNAAPAIVWCGERDNNKK
jgi:hypothetical protein